MWYWLFEFLGNAIGLLGVVISVMILGSIATVGFIKFIEPNSFILWVEIAALIVAGIIIALNIVHDVIKFGKGRK